VPPARTSLRDNCLKLDRQISQIDVTRETQLLAKLVRKLAVLFDTDRISILLLESTARRFRRIHYTGFAPKGEKPVLNRSHLVSMRVIKTQKPFICDNIRVHDDLVSPFTRKYASDACAVFPLTFAGKPLGTLNVSNLARVEEIRADVDALLTLCDHIAQVIHHAAAFAELGVKPELSPVKYAVELKTIERLASDLTKLIDAETMLMLFGDVLSHHFDFAAFGVVFDNLVDNQLAYFYAGKGACKADLKRLFDEMCHVWRKEHPNYPCPNFEGARVIFGDRVHAGKLPRARTFRLMPVTLDERLFATMALALSDAARLTQTEVDLLNILVMHLAVSLKRNQLLARNQELAPRDDLTGLSSERYFHQFLQREFERARRYNAPLALIFCDLDHFRDINDQYGFDSGDAVLVDVAHIILDSARSTDLVSRYGGEKFVIVLPETYLKQAEVLADRMRRFIASHPFFIEKHNVFVKATASFGLAAFQDHKPVTPAQFVEFAETALYFAKRTGRDQVTSYSYVLDLLMKEGGSNF
jgi:diguanylate cyclase (GGDEF)-like protein